MKSYDYAQREGVLDISWLEFDRLARQLAEGLAAQQPEMIVGIARAGLFPATAVACMLRRELFPVRITRRMNDEVVYDVPVWKSPLPPDVAGKVVAVVDEIADSGETLAVVAKAVKQVGAREIITACLVSHSWANPPPDLSALVSDALVIFPWDQQVFVDGEWSPHPEIVSALGAQAGKDTHKE